MYLACLRSWFEKACLLLVLRPGTSLDATLCWLSERSNALYSPVFFYVERLGVLHVEPSSKLQTARKRIFASLRLQGLCPATHTHTFAHSFFLLIVVSVACPTGPHPPLRLARRPNRGHIGGGGWNPSWHMCAGDSQRRKIE